MMYIKISTLEFPLHEGDIRLEYPEILESQTGETFPCPETYAPVEILPTPLISDEQTVKLGVPSQNSTGAWIADWIVQDMTPEEIQAIKDRIERLRKEMQAKTETDSDNPQ